LFQGAGIWRRSSVVVLVCVLALTVGASAVRAASYLYVSDQDSDTVAQFDTVGGPIGLIALAPFTVAAGDGPYGLVARPGGGSLYVANIFSDTISQYDIGPAGQPSPKEAAIAPAGDVPYARRGQLRRQVSTSPTAWGRRSRSTTSACWER
jgi:DNA-binding beta-propeller fold protein YncE